MKQAFQRPCLDDDLVLAELLEPAQFEGVACTAPIVAVNLVELVGHVLAAQIRDKSRNIFIVYRQYSCNGFKMS
jgi:hypothetical protein